MDTNDKTPAAFDLGTIAYSETAKVHILHPVSGERTPITITILGDDTQVIREAKKAQINKRIQRASQGARSLTAEELEAEDVALLVTATVAWEGLTMNGQPFAFNAENARTLYSNPKFRFIREQVDRAITDRTRFFSE